jgi:NhaP-type Na+/H+ or K+/H+ antiporter
MGDSVITGLGTIVVCGVGMQWLARRVRVPAILLLLAAGLVVGPGLGWVDPDQIFGDSLFPVVSLAVGILLFEGGLGLDIGELRSHGARPVVRLVTVGVLITWVALWAVSIPLFGMDVRDAALLGALLVVSGPTVVGPLLKLARPRPPASTILRWEGIVIDPIGATLALVVLQVVLGEGSPTKLFTTAGVGVAVGLALAAVLVAVLRRFLVPDDLELAVTTMFVIGAYTASELISSEAGLFATTVLGVALANQRFVQVRRITAFNEDVGVLLLGGLFIVLAARIDVDQLMSLVLPALGLTAAAVLLVRPLVAWVCTARCGLSRADRIFVAAMCPRGIVAAATSALFTLELAEADQGGEDLASIVFLVIVGTCIVYGLAAAPLARALDLALPHNRGVLLIGAQPWLLALADALADLDVETTVIATGRYELATRPRRWRLFTAPMVTAGVDRAFDGVRTAVVASIDDEHNAVALARCLEDLSRRDVYVLPAARRAVHLPPPSPGRLRALSDRLTGPRRAEAGTTVTLGGGGGPSTGPREGDDELVEVAPAAAWTRRPFAHGITQRELESAFAEHGEVRTLAVPHAEQGTSTAAEALPEGALLLAVRHADGRVDLAPRRTTMAAGDTVVLLG